MSSKTYQVKAVVSLPRVPNFLMLEGCATPDAKISIGSLSDDELREIGRLWTEALIQRAAEMRIPFENLKPGDIVWTGNEE
jgi:hypothetical protein